LLLLASLLAPSSIQETQKHREGYLLHQETGTLYYLHIIEDSTVYLREGLDEGGPALSLPPNIVEAVHTELEALSPKEPGLTSSFEVAYQDRFVVLRFVKPAGAMALMVLIGLVAVAAVLLVAWVRRRLDQERRKRQDLLIAQRYLAEGQEAERLRLARDLHDGPIQDLHALRLLLASGGAPVQSNGSPAADLAETNLLRVIRELRAISEDLRPPVLSRFGLGAAIRGLATRFKETHPSLELELEVTEDEPVLPEATRLALFRICQEAMNNAARHAQARRLRVRFAGQRNGCLLQVEDDGRGFTAPASWVDLGEGGHYGLLGISERAEMIGAPLSVETAPGKGTRLCVTLPAPPLPREPRRKDRASLGRAPANDGGPAAR
jgi:signal transduction histidine kinase